MKRRTTEPAGLLRSRVSRSIAILAIATVAIAAGGVSLRVEASSELLDAVERIRSAHAEARILAARSEGVVRLQILPEERQLRVWQEASDGRRLHIVRDEVLPPMLWVASDVHVICFDARGHSLLAQGCEEQVGAISVGAPGGEEIWLTLVPDGRLLQSASTLGG